MDDPEVDEEERRYLRDVQDHTLRVQEQADGFRQLLQNILNVNLTLETKELSEVSNRQNEEVKKISAWAAILFAPSVVGTVYGMNFDNMPELHWHYGYAYAVGPDDRRVIDPVRRVQASRLDLRWSPRCSSLAARARALQFRVP